MSCHSAWFLSPFIFYSKCGFNELEKSLFIQWNVMGNECKQTHKCTHRQAHTHAHMQTYAIKHQTAVSVQHTYTIGRRMDIHQTILCKIIDNSWESHQKKQMKLSTQEWCIKLQTHACHAVPCTHLFSQLRYLT